MQAGDIIRLLDLSLAGGLNVEVDVHRWFTIRGPLTSLPRGRPAAAEAVVGVPEGGLAQIREGRGESRYKAAKVSGLTYHQVTRLEEGKGVAWAAMRGVADYYGVSIGTLCEWLVSQAEEAPSA